MSWKKVSTTVAVAIVGVILVAFYQGNLESSRLHGVAPNVGMTYDMLQEVAHNAGAQNDNSFGTASNVIYLLACTGLPTAITMESFANLATNLVVVKNMSEREAGLFVLGIQGARIPALDQC